jgi:uncharacterized membrane-anchored protein
MRYFSSARIRIYRNTIPFSLLIAILAFSLYAPDTAARLSQEEYDQKLRALDWVRGPAKVNLGKIGEVLIPRNSMFLDGDNSRKFKELNEGISNGQEVGTILGPSFKWRVVFYFSEIGYIKDPQNEKLDAEPILESLRKGTEEANKIKRKKGWDTMQVVGWRQRPNYNSISRNLEWAIIGENDRTKRKVVNFQTRILGRRGVLKSTLVSRPLTLNKYLPIYKDILAGFSYKSGWQYAEYRTGDKIAEYGLVALITGGAIAIAAKSGLLSILMKNIKWILFGLLAFFGTIWKFVRRLFSREEPPTYSS